MIKKISAIVLALVLCLSVVVMPASAYTLGASSEIAYVIELDKDNYEAGENVRVNLYIYGKAGLEFGTGAILVAMNSAVFDMAENDVTDIKATSTSGDAMASWYKDFNAASIAWLTQANVITNVTNSNTSAENAMFNQYLKIGLAKNTSGSHANIGSNKNGIPAKDINADSEAGIPFVSFELKLKDDLADDTAINIGITSGSMAKTQTYVNYYKTPGTSQTVVKTTAATSEIVNSTTAKIGAAEVPGLTVAGLKQQIKPGTAEDGTFSYRVFADLTNFVDIFGDIAGAKGTDDKTYITEAGFIYNKGTAVDAEKAKAQINGGEVTYSGKNWQRSAYISSTAVSGKYVMACVVYDIPDADAGETLSVLAYVKYVQNGVEKVAMCDAYTGTFETLYNKYCK